ncbi:MAG: transcription-repair coupling factor [Lachnospiraceae bacterium]|nr:transcription-repair coupling factor [Lachnospiraceae bacterium]
MKIFLEPLEQLKPYEEIQDHLQKDSGLLFVSGVTDAAKPHLMNALGQDYGKNLIITYEEQRAREIVDAYRFFRKDQDDEVLFFPAKDILFYQSDIRGNALTKERMKTIEALLTGSNPVVVTTFDALLSRLPSPDRVRSVCLTIREGDTLDFEQLLEDLVKMGYSREYQTEQPGQFAVRGGILDVFPMTDPVPVRIELWGDEVDSIRSFSPETQRSIETLTEFTVFPAGEVILSPDEISEGFIRLKKDADLRYDSFRKDMKTEEAWQIREAVSFLEDRLIELKSMDAAEGYLPYFYIDGTDSASVSILQYFDLNDRIFIDEPQRCMQLLKNAYQEFSEGMAQRLEKGYAIPGQMDLLFLPEQITAKLSAMKGAGIATINAKAEGIAFAESYYLQVRSVSSYQKNFPQLLKDLKSYRKERFRTLLLCSSGTRAKRMAQELTDEGVTAFYSDDLDRALLPGEIMVTGGNLKNGFSWPDAGFVVLTETDLFGAKRKKKRKKRYDGAGIRDFAELHPGDYVVHENYGLGIYRGIEKIEIDHIIKDFMKIEYAQGDNLYVLATQLDVIQKYAGQDAKKPRLNKLNGKEWKRTRSRVEKAVGEIAQELVELYAIRQQTEGYQYEPDTVWQKEFEEQFPYEETSDQLTAIADTKADMESKKIMDRLICGDVGYGKTEVAIRAAFKAVQENKQVVFLVPTTILAQQHYNTFVQRMKDYPVTVELLCRFRTPAQQKASIERLKRGTADIVIGTHRVLSKDVAFKDLGLLIVDEEQRFGVTHKERIKQMKKSVDVLTLTATPIPRTLHMSLVGIRDMSVLEEPPEDRFPVQTYIMEYNEEMVREVVRRELNRGGQVFYVFNRVNQIADMAGRIAKLLPDAEVAYAHGQMPERQLEQIMIDFINGEIDVLVSTTIIETGLDIANANTMIIHDADNMGLSQLYQLRGRIGRSNRTAYAFLMYRRGKILREVAEKRLAAIRDFSELGSGFRIAMKDLEIRGAGNILGEAQSGHMEAVGYDLYCKLLHEAVSEAKGEEKPPDFETALDLNQDAYIPAVYIPDEYQKLDIYKRIAAITNEEDRDEMLDELIDRFGEPPKPVQRLLSAAMLKALAHDAWFTEIREQNNEIRFVMYGQADVDPTRIPELLSKWNHRIRFQADKEHPAFLYQRQKQDGDIFDVIRLFLTDCRDTIVLS